MKKKLLIGFTLAIAACLVFISTGYSFASEADAPVAIEEAAMPALPVTCPNSPSTVQGCLVDIDGCIYINTINGRTIAVSVLGFPVGAGDEVSLTGNWQSDADCAPCVLNATSVTDLGDC